MLLKSVKRPLAIAMCASLVGHLLIAGWLLWSLARFVQPAEKPRVLTLEFSASPDDDPQDHTANDRAETLREAPVKHRAAAPPHARPRPQVALETPAQKYPASPADRRPDALDLEQMDPVGTALANDMSADSPDTAMPEEAHALNEAEAPEHLPLQTDDQSPSPRQVESENPVNGIADTQVDQHNESGNPNAVEANALAANPLTNMPLLQTTGPSRQLPIHVDEDKQGSPVAFNPAEQRMLERRLAKWVARLHRRPAESEPLRWRHKGQAYEARVSRLPARDDTDIDRLAIEVITERNGEQLSTHLQMKMLAFSHFAQFVHRWDPNVQLHNDVLDGRFHSNSRILLTADRDVAPQFLGKVTTASNGIYFSGHRSYRNREQIFQGGLETGVKRIPMSRRQAPAALVTSEGQQRVYRFEQDTHIRFRADGGFSWYNKDPAEAQIVATNGGSIYLAGSRGKTLYVSGELRGSVLVYSPRRIVIEGNLTYAQAAAEAPEHPTFLGLVSEGNVEIAEPEVTGPGPLYVHAAIYAGQKFKVRDYRHRDQSRLYIFGSLSAGTLSATEPRYATHIEFDRRLEEQRPPGYPVTDRFELAAWDAQWRPRLDN